MKNPVAKYARRFNKSVVMQDKKKEMKRTGGRWNLDDDFYDSAGGFNEKVEIQTRNN